MMCRKADRITRAFVTALLVPLPVRAAAPAATVGEAHEHNSRFELLAAAC